MTHTCLVVDDSRVVRKVARRILEAHGFIISEAGDGKEALEACRASMPDCVLLDWNMPVIARGRLYIRTPVEIICYDIRDESADGQAPK